MILMWLGSFFLLMWGLMSFQKNIASFFAGFQKSILEKGFSPSMLGLFTQSALFDVSEASTQKSLYSAMALLNLRILGTRPAVLLMCLSPLAAIPVFFLGSTFLAFSGFFLLGICSLVLLRFWKSKKVDAGFQILFSLGIFLVGAESLLRNSQVLQTYLADGDLIFFLLDGRFTAVLTLLLISFILSFVVQVEFWSLILGLSLLSTATVSFNGALAILVGERLASGVLFWWRTKNLNQECRKVGQQYALVIFVSSVLGFWFAGESRALFDVGFSSDLNATQDKALALLTVFGIILGTQLIIGMVWGHFAGNSKADEIQHSLYFSPSWIDRDLLSEGTRSWAKERVHKRLSEIRYHVAGLQTLKENQVPAPLQGRLLEEEKQLSQLHF